MKKLGLICVVSMASFFSVSITAGTQGLSTNTYVGAGAGIGINGHISTQDLSGVRTLSNRYGGLFLLGNFVVGYGFFSNQTFR